MYLGRTIGRERQVKKYGEGGVQCEVSAGRFRLIKDAGMPPGE